MSTIEHLSPEQFSEPEPDVEYLSLAEAGPMVEALRSRTAQSIMAELSHEPTTTSELAGRIETSLQNVGYHLSQLEDAGLVTVVGTRYSEKGAEMKVYARTVAAIVIGETTPPDEWEGAAVAGLEPEPPDGMG